MMGRLYADKCASSSLGIRSDNIPFAYYSNIPTFPYSNIPIP